MKKFFTSVFAAALMAAPVGNLSAQSAPLTKAEQDQVVKEVLPVVFDQIKEQAGIDILGWAKPQLANNVLTGVPVLETKSMLRAAEGKPVTAKPDSILVYGSAINPTMGKMVGDIKVTFEEYDTKKIEIADKNVELDLPANIVVNSTKMGQLVKLMFDSKINFDNKAAVKDTIFSMGIDFVLFQNPQMDLLKFSLAQNKTSLAIDGDLVVEDGLKKIFELLGMVTQGAVKPLPNLNYLVSLDIAKFLTSENMAAAPLPCTLKGVKPNSKAATDTISMGDAELNINLAALMQKGFPLNDIKITGYEKGQADKWTQLAFGLTNDKEDPRDLTLTVDKSEFEGGFEGKGEYKRSTVFTMSDNRALPTDVKSAVQTVVTRVVNELANEGKASWYKLAIAQGPKNDLKNVLEAEVTPYLTNDNHAIADVDIIKYDEKGNKVPMLVRAKAEIGGKNLITIQYQIAGKEVVTGYFTSNAAESILSNESVAVSNVKVIPTANGVRVLNAERANYSIYSITGSLSANGTISGDEVISTSNLAKGIYIIAVEANGVTQSIKFVR